MNQVKSAEKRNVLEELVFMFGFFNLCHWCSVFCFDIILSLKLLYSRFFWVPIMLYLVEDWMNKLMVKWVFWCLWLTQNQRVGFLFITLLLNRLKKEQKTYGLGSKWDTSMWNNYDIYMVLDSLVGNMVLEVLQVNIRDSETRLVSSNQSRKDSKGKFVQTHEGWTEGVWLYVEYDGFFKISLLVCQGYRTFKMVSKAKISEERECMAIHIRCYIYNKMAVTEVIFKFGRLYPQRIRTLRSLTFKYFI